ncbi:MAG: hypothetical protein FWG31_05545 [Oscillospiraceae bacterium]|nr:hypothetical protein [Oscillospiraceae bacterium]
MSVIAQRAANMLDMLPEQDQTLAFELIKKMVLAWDPDYTKLTPEERQELEFAEREIENGDVISHEDIDWN